jgi:L-threonylcarbamoyladenylate synthase
MRQVVVDALTPDPDLIAEAAAILREGGIVAYPTDTLYGLAVDPHNTAAVARLIALKGRAASSSIALIAGDRDMAEEAGSFGTIERTLARAFWPGPLTIVVAASPAMSPLLAPRQTLGVRVPDHAVARALSAAFRGCVTATSANRSGDEPAVSPGEVERAVGDGIDFLLDAGTARGGPPSTIVEVVDGRPTLHRSGAVAWDRVLEFVK